MRGLIDLDTPHPLASFLPGIYQEDGLYLRFLSAFDAALAPVFATLDNLDAYLDPRLTPADFLEWLAGWVGFSLDERWPLEKRRAFVLHAVDLYRRRGTVRGLQEHIRILIGGGTVEVIDSGGVTWSTTSLAPPTDPAPAAVVVRVRTDHPHEVDLGHLERLVAAAKPAHVSHRVEVAGTK